MLQQPKQGDRVEVSYGHDGGGRWFGATVGSFSRRGTSGFNPGRSAAKRSTLGR